MSILDSSWNYTTKRGEYVDIDYIDETRRNIIYNIPLSEIVFMISLIN